ncbi:hypothetical protein G7059_08070 [Erysipelothrix sp. HDW6A]|uniref:hypothetical protein n=1 Tax=Erysipelothrix sp. HDW6A TaxID=2714928 RepID=UPI0014081081|nr:hypothetical protein [Erysipelothrix sp. HDW6A]QIK57798.1 hypothetical protein G7059_08070 [Erysipelothrix sp. HDW6A]
MNLTWSEVQDILEIYLTTAKQLVRKYKHKWTASGLKLVDRKKIPTWFFIYQYSKEFGVAETELCKKFNYELRNYEANLTKYKKHLEELEKEREKCKK